MENNEDFVLKEIPESQDDCSSETLQDPWEGMSVLDAPPVFATLRHTCWRYARLQGANFTGKDLTGADFSYADLSGAIFVGAVLTGTTFQYATLRGAIFGETP